MDKYRDFQSFSQASAVQFQTKPPIFECLKNDSLVDSRTVQTEIWRRIRGILCTTVTVMYTFNGSVVLVHV